MTRLALLALLALAACGKRGLLEPNAGQAPPPTPVFAAAAPTPAQMLERPPEAAPERVDDIIKRPEATRGDDPFDLPPQGRR